MKPFVINRHGRIVFPGNFFPELDFSVFETLEQFTAVIRRDFGDKAPTEADIVTRVQAGSYHNRYDLCRDLALNLFWVNRYVLTMYEKRPTRWGDLPRHRDDIFLPVYKPRDEAALTKAIEEAYKTCRRRGTRRRRTRASASCSTCSATSRAPEDRFIRSTHGRRNSVRLPATSPAI